MAQDQHVGLEKQTGKNLTEPRVKNHCSKSLTDTPWPQIWTRSDSEEMSPFYSQICCTLCLNEEKKLKMHFEGKVKKYVLEPGQIFQIFKHIFKTF